MCPRGRKRSRERWRIGSEAEPRAHNQRIDPAAGHALVQPRGAKHVSCRDPPICTHTWSVLMPTNTATGLPPIVSQAEWESASKKILAREKQLTREHDRLAAERRRMPMVQITKRYIFDGQKGKASLADLFEGRPQLILYHFMFGPGASGWPTAGCDGCSMVADQIPHLAHLHARNTSFAMVSRAPLASILAYEKRMGWTVPWYSSAASDFNDDFGTTTPTGEIFGLSVFLREGERVFRT
jgi:predicted dithiol-disulfide oxidoreductase (DUF899 family)